MARIESDKIVKRPAKAKATAGFAELRKAANQQSPVSTTYEDASTYPKKQGR
jgi:hypothetical protein